MGAGERREERGRKHEQEKVPAPRREVGCLERHSLDAHGEYGVRLTRFFRRPYALVMASNSTRGLRLSSYDALARDS